MMMLPLASSISSLKLLPFLLKSQLQSSIMDIRISPTVLDVGDQIQNVFNQSHTLTNPLRNRAELNSISLASITQLSHSVQDVMELFDPLFPGQAKVMQLNRYLPLLQNNPSAFKIATHLLLTLHQNGIEQSTLENFGELIGHIQEKLVTENSTALNTSQNKAPLINTFRQNEWLTQIHQIMTNVLETNSHPQTQIKDLVQYLNTSLQERPNSFEQEILSLPILTKMGFSLKEQQQLSDTFSPLILSSTLIKLEESNPQEFHRLIQEIKIKLPQPEALKQMAQNEVHYLKEQLQWDESKLRGSVFLEEALFKGLKSETKNIILSAFSPSEGFIAPQQIEIQPHSYQHLLHNAVFFASQLEAGKHPIRFKIKNKKNEQSSELNLFFFILSNEEEEEENPQTNDKASFFHSNSIHAYQQQSPSEKEKLEKYYLGEIKVKLDQPFFIFQKESTQAIQAPLLVSFQFLSKWVHPDFKYSRDHFLTFDQSKEAKEFITAVQKLNQKDQKAYKDYVFKLDSLFQKLEKISPQSKESFKKAKQFLRDEVLLYGMGKKNAANEEKVEMIEKSSEGDLIASICLSTANSLAHAGVYSDALVHFSQAAQHTKDPQNVSKQLENFFNYLEGSHDKPYPLESLPLFPSSPQDPYSRNKERAEQFISYFRQSS